MARLRRALLRTVTPDDIAAIVRALVARAKDGDTLAAREILNRTLGRPLEADILERVEALERAQAVNQGLADGLLSTIAGAGTPDRVN